MRAVENYFPIGSKLLQRVLQIGVLESEVSLDPSAPACFIIEVNVCSLLILIGGDLGFFMTLKPSHIFFMKAPTLLLELTRGQILLVRPLGVVENEEKSISSELLEDVGVLEDRRRRGRIRSRRRVRVLRRIGPGTFVVRGRGGNHEGFVQCGQI